MSRIFLLFIFLFPVSCFAQYTISGRILNQADTKPVANASVFLSNATIGDKTTANGTFTLPNVKPGKYELVVSIIGFETFDQTITIGNSNITLPDITIFPKTIALNEVKVKPDDKRDDYYAQFKDEFLGTSELAKQCKILNPEILDLAYDDTTNTLTASTTGFLEIENDALGYKLNYLLSNFVFNDKDRVINYQGYALFQLMRGTPAEERLWQKKRQEVYEGSSMHFLRSALSNRIEEEGFRVLQLVRHPNPERPPEILIEANIKYYKERQSGERGQRDSLAYWEKKEKLVPFFQTLMPVPLNKQDIIKPAKQQGIYMLGHGSDVLHITYNKNHRFSQKPQVDHLENSANTSTTIVSFNSEGALFDANGGIFNPGDVVFSGFWIRNRIAELLPLDYEPTSNKIVYKDTLLKSDTVLRNTITKLKTFSANYIVEKAYLHLDKPDYAINDTIWFKAYVVAGEHHRLSALSGVLYAELVNPADSVVKRLALHLTSGIASGDFEIPGSYKPGNYHIRAYTNWMRNAGADYFYNQEVQIGGMQLSLNTPKQAMALRPDVQFFPEGGQLVNGVRSRVAVKAINANGLGEDIKGTVEDNEGNVVADFATQHLGMGVFALIPQSGKTYKAKISGEGETVFTVDLPKAQEDGFTLALNNSKKDSIYVKVAVNEKTFNDNKNAGFYIVAQSDGKIYYTTQGKLEGQVYTAEVEKSRFPSGIVQFTLFSQSGEPLAERIAFIQSPDTLKLNIAEPTATFNTRQKVKIAIDVKDNDNNPVTGSFSAAVINESRVGIDEAREGTIFNNLLLTSDLKGYIERPNYYFINPNDKTNADLDILMLTQGYRRFEWKAVLNNTAQPVMCQPEKSLELAGTLKTSSGKPVPNGKVILAATRENFHVDTMTDINGDFKFTDLYLSDTSKIILRARKANNGSNVAIYVKQPDYPPVVKQKNSDDITGLSQEMMAVMQKNYNDYEKQKISDSLKNGIKLKQVTINAKKENRAPDMSHSANLHGGGNADQVIMGDKLDGCVTLSDCLNGKIMGVTFEDGVPYNLHTVSVTKGAGALVLIVDGIFMDGSHLNDLDANNIYSIEVLRTGASVSIYGSNASSGALVITTKRGTEGSNYVTTETPSGLITYPFKGFYKAREFYSPRYDNPKTSEQAADFRTTIYWNPNIITGKDGKAAIEYFNADTKGTYRVVIEGIDENGNLGRQVFRYIVK